MKEITPEIEELVKKLGALVRADERYKEFVRLSGEYASDDAVNRALTEYNVQQSALTEAYAAAERDDALIEVIQARINVLYGEITANPVYVQYREAGERYEAFYKAVYAEIEFAITGKRSDCTHDCSTCGGCH